MKSRKVIGRKIREANKQAWNTRFVDTVSWTAEEFLRVRQSNEEIAKYIPEVQERIIQSLLDDVAAADDGDGGFDWLDEEYVVVAKLACGHYEIMTSDVPWLDKKMVCARCHYEF